MNLWCFTATYIPLCFIWLTGLTIVLGIYYYHYENIHMNLNLNFILLINKWQQLFKFKFPHYWVKMEEHRDSWGDSDQNIPVSGRLADEILSDPEYSLLIRQRLLSQQVPWCYCRESKYNEICRFPAWLRDFYQQLCSTGKKNWWLIPLQHSVTNTGTYKHSETIQEQILLYLSKQYYLQLQSGLTLELDTEFWRYSLTMW